ncbi:MAG: LamG domain-containing protein [Lachnospiraceae bacterium]|nr:LamG domain-containing protein [Lachnospiraceae bacterium]
MRKKVLSIIICLCMVATLFAGCKKKETEPDAGSDKQQVTATEAPAPTKAEPTPEPTKAPAPAGEALPEAKYYFSFDQADGTSKIQPSIKDSAATPIVQPAPDKEVVLIDGVKGQALYCNGAYGYKIPEVNGVGETYSISFWVYARRFANYMPTIQYGPDMHGDATGGQHYLNFTRAEWSGEGEYPCVWSYDQIGDEAVNWPNWFPNDGGGERLNQWLNITLVVDENNTTDEGSNLIGKIYLNGELFNDSVTLVTGTMAPSDNFDFLLGINYWDAYFKGAIDEVYIFDKVLTEGQVQTLYLAGDPNAKFVEPERVVVVTPDASAIETIGSTGLSNTWGSSWTSSFEIKNGETKKVKLHNWSSGKASTDNYGIQFGSAAAAGQADPKTAEGYKSYGLVRADATGEGYVDAQYNYTWGNWNTWSQSAMVDATVTLTITREGDTLTVVANNVDYNGTSNDMTAVVKTTLTETDPCFFAISCENAYVDLLSVKDATVRANAGLTVGSENLDNAFWSVFSPIWKVNKGESRTIGFTNYTDGTATWNNFVVILQNVPGGHSADAYEGYAEYGVVRADNFGWGAGYDNIATAECDWNLDTFCSDIDGAHVTLTVTNNGDTADITAIYRTTAGTELHQKYTGIAIGEDLYFCLTCEKSLLQFDSTIVGNTDLTTGWWTQFSDIWAVPEGEARSVSFTNYTDGAESWNNFVAILQNVPGGHSADAYEGYSEYAVVRADNFGWGSGYDNIAVPETDWDVINDLKNEIDGARIDLTVFNNGTTADVVYTATTTDGKIYHQKYTGIATGGDLYFCLSCEKSYLVLESNTVGNIDNTTGWWSNFSQAKEVAEGSTEYFSFTNYTDGAENWRNFLVVLQTTPTGHAAETTEGYAEYAVVRADNYGWGSGYDNTAVVTSNWNWETIKNDLDGAHVIVAITNNGATADIHCTITTAAGTVYFQNYDGIATGGPLYAGLLCEGSHLNVTQ